MSIGPAEIAGALIQHNEELPLRERGASFLWFEQEGIDHCALEQFMWRAAAAAAAEFANEDLDAEDYFATGFTAGVALGWTMFREWGERG